MSASTSVALAFAAAGAVGYGVASVLQAVGARHRPGLLNTLRNPAYLGGFGLDLLAWLASLVALRTLPVYQVQAVLASSLAVTVLAARLALAARLRAVDVAAVAVTVVALGALAAAAGPQSLATPPSATRLALALAAAPVALAGWIAARRAPPAVTGALAGLAYGGAALCARAVTLPDGAPAAVLTATLSDPLAWALAVFGVTGTLLYAHALEHGQVGPVTALLWIAEVLVPSAAGVLLLGDTVRPGWGAVAAVAVTVTVAAAAVLAHAPANAATAAPASPVDAADAPPVPGDRPGRPHRGCPGPRRFRRYGRISTMKARLLTLAAATVLAGCGTTPARPAAARPGVSIAPPGTASSQSAVPTPANGPECLAPGVAVSVGEVDAAMGLRAVALTLRNCGTAVYTAHGYPVIDVLDADGKVLDVTVLDGTSNVASIERYDAPPERVDVAPGGTAVAVLVWRNLTTDAATVAKGASLSVAPAEGQPRHSVTLFVDPGNTGRLAVSPWTAA